MPQKGLRIYKKCSNGRTKYVQIKAISKFFEIKPFLKCQLFEQIVIPF